MSNPRVYVGTYGKYNGGSLAGGWIALKDCKDYKQFLSKCRALHKGERDPEYMIQDSEGFPDGLDCMEWLSEQDFNDVMQACSEEKEEEVSITDRLRAALLKQLDGAPAAKEDGNSMMDEFMKEWEKVWPNDKRMLDYERSTVSGLVRLQNGGILSFDKPSIETKFCFHDEGPDYEFYKELMKKEENLREYFIDRNLGAIDRTIETLEKPDTDCRSWYIQRESYSGETAPLNLWKHVRLQEWDIKNHPSWYGDVELMSDADRKVIIAGLKIERDKFEKRLNAYLKRYGVSKLHTWTYWADA